MGKKNKHLNDEEIYYEYQKKGKVLPIIVIVMAVIGLSYLFFIGERGGSTDEKASPEQDISKSKTIVEKDFVSGLRLASLGKYDEAIGHFDGLIFNDLSDSDRQIVLNAFLKAGKPQKALDLDEKFDKEIVDEFIEKGEPKILTELKTDSKLIAFEIAVMENNFKEIIKLKDVKRLKMDRRRANAISNAYFQLGKKEEAINFASLMVFNGINMWDNNTDDTTLEQMPLQTSEQSSSNSFIVIIAMVFILLGVGVLLYFFKSKINSIFKKGSERKTSNKIISKKKKVLQKDMSKNSEHKEDGSEENDKYSYYYDE
ncbi:hypothetical protein WMZ97_16605 [Lentibacillus sp. N15]|uniref:hypothetical protein n=1 Tax=Lentibacillus songyuanensis TaxID=3136161 RepID=UPI0031BAE2FA